MGLQFKNNKPDKNTLSNSLTVCIRFKFSNLGYKGENKPIVLLIDDEKSENRSSLLHIKARYPWNWMGIGPFYSDTIGVNWLLLDHRNSPINFFKPMWWHHICLSFSTITAKVIMTKVCENTVYQSA